MKKHAKLAVLGLSAGMLGALAAPAHAATSSGVTVSLNTAGPSATGRTLSLYNTSGQALSSLDLSGGTQGFIAKVTDNNYSPNGFTVSATMSNLYGYSGGTWNCAALVPSSALSLSSPPGLLDESGLGSGMTPAYVLNGDLTTVLSTLLTSLNMTSAVVTNAPVTGLAQSLNESQLTGGQTGDLVGSTLTSLANKLPITLATGSAGAFTNPAADPSGASCGVAGSSATSVPVMQGTANLTNISSDLQAVLNTLPNDLTSTLISNNYLDSTAVMTEVSTALNIPLTLLTPYTSQIESTLTGTLGSVPLVSGLTAISGNYSSSPSLSVNTSGVPSGSYRGTMTITLVDS